VSVGFIKKKFATTRGHVKVKLSPADDLIYQAQFLAML
jgi:hypothetical protein